MGKEKAIIILGLILLAGCADEIERTPLQKAQDRLLSEINSCGLKFGDDYEQTRQANIEYCRKLVIVLDGLIRDGFFTDQGKLEMVKQVAQDMNITTQEYEKKTYDVTTEIIGEI